MARHGRSRMGSDTNERDVFAFQRRNNRCNFIAFAGIGNGNHDIVVHNHAQIAVCRFGRMDEKRRRACRSHGCRHFTADVSGLTHAGNDDPALAVQQRFRRTDKIMVQSRRNFTQTFGFRIQYIARPVEIKCVFRHQSHLSCLNLGLFCPN